MIIDELRSLASADDQYHQVALDPVCDLVHGSSILQRVQLSKQRDETEAILAAFTTSRWNSGCSCEASGGSAVGPRCVPATTKARGNAGVARRAKAMSGCVARCVKRLGQPHTPRTPISQGSSEGSLRGRARNGPRLPSPTACW